MRITYDPEADALYLYLSARAGEDGAAVETLAAGAMAKTNEAA